MAETTLARALLVDMALEQLCSPPPSPPYERVLEIRRAWQSRNGKAVMDAARFLDAVSPSDGSAEQQAERDAVEARITDAFTRLRARHFPENRGDEERCPAFLAHVERGAFDALAPAALDDANVDD
ncbi:hypothetical protein [Luteimonas terrae]|uniref:Uncharacterized protein n=1 Tax=Luteimonas terrae TaxID=1530191 RepID=A0ABU1Y0R5_9GAMM|nr:hypothetical protein [Luteimonas terrae]MDR7194030.1 hypothetical protein [Luteimonas terrae]